MRLHEKIIYFSIENVIFYHKLETYKFIIELNRFYRNDCNRNLCDHYLKLFKMKFMLYEKHGVHKDLKRFIGKNVYSNYGVVVSGFVGLVGFVGFVGFVGLLSVSPDGLVERVRLLLFSL